MTDHNRHANSRIARRWPAIRARGMRCFVLVQGLLVWGGVMFLAMAVMAWINFGPGHPRFALMIGVAAALCAVGSLIWGVLTWVINERIYKYLETNRRLP